MFQKVFGNNEYLKVSASMLRNRCYRFRTINVWKKITSVDMICYRCVKFMLRWKRSAASSQRTANACGDPHAYDCCMIFPSFVYI
jgi:hypothetical protein